MRILGTTASLAEAPVIGGAAAEVEGSAIESEIIRLFDQHRSGLLHYVMSLGLARADSEEIVQEVFLQLFRHLSLGRPRDNLHGWIFRVGHNMALKQRQRGGRMALCADVPEQATAAAEGPEHAAASAERRRHLLAAVSALAPRDRRCLALRAEGLHYREIGRILGISVGSVSNSLARSVGRLMHVYGSAAEPAVGLHPVVQFRPTPAPVRAHHHGPRPAEDPACV